MVFFIANISEVKLNSSVKKMTSVKKNTPYEEGVL